MSSLPLSLQILRTIFGYEHFRGHQAAIVDQLVGGDDVLALMPTGGGKSLCYQIPSLIRPGTGVVISPLIALMQDQVENLRQVGIRAAFLNSTLSFRQQRQVERAFLSGVLDLLYVAPERLTTDHFLSVLQQAQVALFAIDEAHCVSQWGHDFRSDYWELALLHEKFPHVPRIALTATADERTRQEIITRLGLEQAHVFCASFDRPNIRYTIQLKQKAVAQLLRFLRTEHSRDSGIIYCLSRKKVEAVARYLNQNGFSALPYHAGLTHEEREAHQRQFVMEEGIIIVATIAFGMGIDKPNVRFVAHLDLPKSIESYYQETGRAGRDGEPSSAWMVYGLQEVILLRQMVEGSEADEVHKRVGRTKLEAMLGFCEVTSCRRKALLGYFGETMVLPCGNCDNCLFPPRTWNGTEAARKALSCVYRTNQKFGVHYVIDVLLGKDNDRIRQCKHHRLSTYGIGKDLDTKQWLSVFRQLVMLGYLTVDYENYGALKLTERCRPILRGETHLELRCDEEKKDTFQQDTKSVRASVTTTKKHSLSDPKQYALWEALRTLRKQIADAQNIPPYMILHDTSLLEMVRSRPRTLSELEQISGMGEHKREQYGQTFLALIQEHGVGIPSDYSELSETVEETLKWLKKGMQVKQIAEQRHLKPSTIYEHLAVAIRNKVISCRESVDIPEEEISNIKGIWKNLPLSEQQRSKPLYDALEGRYEYGMLQCFLAEWRLDSGETHCDNVSSASQRV